MSQSAAMVMSSKLFIKNSEINNLKVLFLFDRFYILPSRKII